MRRADFIHKITWLFLAIGILTGTASIAVEPVILKVWQLPDARKTDPYAQADLAVLDAFREQFPHIELRDFSGIKIEGSESLDTGPLMAIAGGVSPDVIYVNFRQSDTYIQNNFLYPLDTFMADLSQEDLDLRVAKPVWPVIKRKGSDSVKRTWALPYGTLVRVLIYRKDLFRKAGLDPNKPPATWDELLD
jgi:ABC-type glycerol-3-phosphate transport system substrate-binding protein